MESKIKKRKIAEEKIKFNIQWTEKYFVTELCDNIICLIIMIKLPYARNTISNVIMVQNMGQNIKN